MTPSKIVRWGKGLALGTLLLTCFAGVLHMPFARPLLRMVSPASICPVMRGSPEQIDHARAIAAASIRSATTANAPARPALGFVLDQTQRQDVRAWAAAKKIKCSSIGGNDHLQSCGPLPASALGEPDDFGDFEEVTFEFRATGELVHVQTTRRHLTVASAAATASRLETKAAEVLGPPSASAGAATVTHLSHGVLSTYSATHTFADYRATIVATNLAPTGVMVREEYLSMR